jgi:hypothetical protein
MAVTIISALSVQAQVFFYLACLVQEKNLACFLDLEILPNSKSGFPSLSSNVHIHGRLSEPLLETKAAIRKPEQALRRLVSDFTAVNRNFILNSFTKRQPKIVKTNRSHSKSTVSILRF